MHWAQLDRLFRCGWCSLLALPVTTEPCPGPQRCNRRRAMKPATSRSGCGNATVLRSRWSNLELPTLAGPEPQWRMRRLCHSGLFAGAHNLARMTMKAQKRTKHHHPTIPPPRATKRSPKGISRILSGEARVGVVPQCAVSARDAPHHDTDDRPADRWPWAWRPGPRRRRENRPSVHTRDEPRLPAPFGDGTA